MNGMKIVFLWALVLTVNALAAEPTVSTNVFVFDVGNSTPEQVQELLQKLFPGVNHGKVAAVQTINSSSTDKAEAINAQAMRDFQKRWEIHLKNPTTTLPPVLYPAKSQRIIEGESPASAETKQVERKNPS
jgi:hypothetical protein